MEPINPAPPVTRIFNFPPNTFYLLAAITLLTGSFGRLQALGLALALAVLGSLLDPHFFEFSIGVVAFLLFEVLQSRLGALRNLFATLLLIVGGVILPSLMPVTMDARVQSWAFGSFCIVLGAALLQIQKIKGTLANHLGAISYPFYLFQWLSIPLVVRGLAFFGAPTGELVLVLTLTLTWLGSHLLNKFWDEPIKRKLASAGW